MKITINDVAKAAGVSKGTVDRVLHNRGEVSPSSREKVLKVVKEMGYSPNVYASILASRKEIRIVCLIPSYQPGEVWELTARGIGRGAGIVSRYGVAVETVTYDQYDNESFRAACAEVLGMNPSGVILAPMFRSDTLRFVRELKGRGILYVYIDSKLDDDDYFAYFGMPMYQSGYLCAHLLTLSGTPQQVTMVRILRDKKGLSDPTAGRRAGFLDYMKEFCPDTRITNILVDPKKPQEIRASLEKEFREDPGMADNIVMFNSRIHLVAQWLREKGISGGNVVGFDILDKNVAALRDGTVKFLIAQHSDTQAAAAVSALVDSLLNQQNPAKRDNLTQLDIITKYNCDYYL